MAQKTTQQHTLEIQRVINGDKPSKEFIVLYAKEAINTNGFAVVDRTFTQQGKLSNEFRHIFILPSIDLKADEYLVICTGKGKDGKEKSPDGKTIHAIHWGADDCVWNDAGGDTATLINFITVNSVTVPAVKKD